MNDRIKWSDKEWAAHLDITEQQVPGIRKDIETYYLSYVAQTKKATEQPASVIADGKWHLFIDRRHDTPSGSPRFIPMVSCNDGFDTAELAAKDANERIIPTLEFTPLVAKLNGFPVRALQLLRVNIK
jgi:hypothetical protein